jgi:hypothetical protein
MPVGLFYFSEDTQRVYDGYHESLTGTKTPMVIFTSCKNPPTKVFLAIAL